MQNNKQLKYLTEDVLIRSNHVAELTLIQEVNGNTRRIPTV